MNGLMLQALIEDRFKLKLHHDTREVPVYALTVAKSGFKLRPVKEGNCIPIDSTKPSDASKMQAAFLARQAAPNFCGLAWIKGIDGRAVRLEMIAASLAELSDYLGGVMDRPLIDKTGITGRFDFHLEFAPDETTPRLLHGGDDLDAASPAAFADDSAGPSVFTAVQQRLGLKLEPAKGPGEFLVIDHVERPSEN